MRDVRTVKQTISFLLTVQLLVSFGLCGGLCCINLTGSSAQPSAQQVAESEENLPPCHRKKAEEKQRSQSYSQHSAAGKATASLLNRNCCAQKREIPEGESLPSTAAPQTGKIISAPSAPPWWDNNLDPASSSVPIQFSASHSPPHTGFQLSLRI
jgi:hypothetical protein